MFNLKGENMPNCFCLIRKTDREMEVFSKIDEDLCKVLGVPCDLENFVTPLPSAPYYTNWYDSIGGRLAMGWPLEGEKDGKTLDLRLEDAPEMETDEEKAYCDAFAKNYNKILAHLRENYTSDAWATR